MDNNIEKYYDSIVFGELITITKTGIVNCQQIVIDPKHDQLIHTEKLYYKYYTRLNVTSDSDHDGYEVSDIKQFSAVYYNGVQIVHKGKVFTGGLR